MDGCISVGESWVALAHVDQVGCSDMGSGWGRGTRAGLVGLGWGWLVVGVGVGDDHESGKRASGRVGRWWWCRGQGDRSVGGITVVE
jgi:hypothetical protein